MSKHPHPPLPQFPHVQKRELSPRETAAKNHSCTVLSTWRVLSRASLSFCLGRHGALGLTSTSHQPVHQRLQLQAGLLSSQLSRALIPTSSGNLVGSNRPSRVCRGLHTTPGGILIMNTVQLRRARPRTCLRTCLTRQVFKASPCLIPLGFHDHQRP